MLARLFFKWLFACTLALLASGCLMKQTVTRNGQVMSEDYVVKRPLKDAIMGTD